MTRLLLLLSVSLALLIVVGLLGRYGTVHPCGILSYMLRMQLIRATLAPPETGKKEELDAKRATQQVLPMIDRFIKTKSSWTCTKGLYRVWVLGEEVYPLPRTTVETSP